LRLVAQLTSLGTKGAIIADESDVGGQPAVTSEKRPAGFDTDGDGIPDTWETAHGLNPNSAADGTGDSGDGYTNVEKYLNELADVACPGGASPTPSDAGIPRPADGATPGVDAGPTPGRDAGFPAGPDAPILGSDAPALRLDAGSPGNDTSATRPDAASPASDAPVATPGSDASAPSPDAASPGADVTTSRPDLAIVATDVAVLPGDAAPSAADGRVSGTPDAPVQASAGPDAAGADSGSTTGPATAASGCSCSTGSGRSRDHLGFLPLAVGLLFVVRRWSVRRRR
jgi:MYXO-CTERM domain-containing protein